MDGRHQYYRDIRNHFIGFWCLWDADSIIAKWDLWIQKNTTTADFPMCLWYENCNNEKNRERMKKAFPVSVWVLFFVSELFEQPKSGSYTEDEADETNTGEDRID